MRREKSLGDKKLIYGNILRYPGGTCSADLIAVALLLKLPFLNVRFDEEADVLYYEWVPNAKADETEVTADDLIIRYRKGEVIGITVLHASQRNSPEKD
ncbi:MAG: DUF2283 domain-containing protein [Bacteroidetes bacterium]|nr:DUF2283 domain-containing protein [Bacteroidota bacterium]